MNGMRFLKYGKWIFGAAAASLSVTYCSPESVSSSSWTPSKPSNVPDTYGAKWDYNWDKRETMKPKATRHLILIRHGQYNTKGKDDTEHYLTSLGKEQATLTGIRLKNSGIHFDSIVSSAMTRAIQTAELILKELDRPDLCLGVETQDPLLSEGAPCMPEPPQSNWQPRLFRYYEEGARIEAAFRKYVHRAEPEQEKDSYELIVCHGNVIRYFACRALQVPGEAWLRIQLNNCSLTCISIKPSGRVSLRALGDSGHMPAKKVS